MPDRVTNNVLALLDIQPHFPRLLRHNCPHDDTCITAHQMMELHAGQTVTCQCCGGIIKPQSNGKK
jgi:hypothetical protein